MFDDVVLRDVTESDLSIFFEQQLDPQASQMAAFPSRDRPTFIAHWLRVLGDQSSIKQTILCAGRVAGNVGCWEQDGEREIGYWLGREYWGKGIATKALEQFLQHVAVRPLYAHVAKHNRASIRVLEKCGFAIVGEDKEFAPGEEIEGVILELPADASDEAL